MVELLEHNRETFVDHLKRQGIRDPAVLRAMGAVPREEFVGVHLREFAYDDSPLPIEEGQTISQPYIVALMTEALRLSAEDRVLEVGTGSGYAAAVLAEIAREVYSVERHRSLAHQAAQRLARLGYRNVEVLCGDGTLGWPEHAPYDAIVVAAAGPDAPRALIEQLAIGGRLVIPTGPTTRAQNLLRVTRVAEDLVEIEELGAVVCAAPAAARARDRRHLPPGNGAAEPLLPRLAAAPVRRIHLVRPDPRGKRPRHRSRRGHAGHFSVRPLSPAGRSSPLPAPRYVAQPGARGVHRGSRTGPLGRTSIPCAARAT
jgi:protein-L-isoaspartate(D-aspartate) O-methyltransferase